MMDTEEPGVSGYSASLMSKCSVGVKLDKECHKQTYCRKVGLSPVAGLEKKSQELLSWRTDIKFGDEDMICQHHETVYLSRYESLQKFCCDPFHIHKKKLQCGLKLVHEKAARDFDLKPGQKICQKCEKLCLQKLENPESSTTQSSGEDFEPQAVAEQNLDESVQLLGISPLKHVSQRDKHGYGKRKLRDIEEAAKSKVAKLLDLPTEELTSSLDKGCDNCKDLDKLLELLKEKCSISTRQEKVKILTLVPESWTIHRTISEFHVTEHLVKKARELKKHSGILADPEGKIGRKLDPVLKDRVISFYQRDEFSRMCPGKKEYVSIKIDGERKQIQKRLLLINLKELYIEYIKETGDKIGISKFCELRPKWCVPVTSSGMHSVCVCQHHQNPKLLCAVIPEINDYQDLLNKMVCSLENRTCMLHYCDQCPGKDGLKDYLMELFSTNDIDLDDILSFKQWVHTDRTSLVSLQLPVSEFITQVCMQFHELRSHHFIAKAQSKFLCHIKETISSDTAIVLLDFAENYSFVIQDAVQGHHWDNSQATLHPFSIYVKNEAGSVQNLSFCVISDCLKHDTVTVHAFICKVLTHIKQTLPSKNKILYFSDGAASQYKNYKNFSNLCHHEEDFGLQAEWNFFATSHGKSPCDGIGGTVKRLVSRASLQAIVKDQILTAKDMFQWSEKNIVGIKFFYMTTEEIQQNATHFRLDQRFSVATKIAGTRSHHSYTPVSSTRMEIRRISSDVVPTTVCIGPETIDAEPPLVIPSQAELDIYQPGKYIACVYDRLWYIGNIVERNDVENDVFVNFMKHGRGNTFSWPPEARKDQCWVPFLDILCVVEPPDIKHHSGRQYQLSDHDFKHVKELFSSL